MRDECGLPMSGQEKKIPVFPLTCSKILGFVGRKNIIFYKIVLASFYRGHILTLILIVLAQKWQQQQNFMVGKIN